MNRFGPYAPSVPDWMRQVSGSFNQAADKFGNIPFTTDFFNQAEVEAQGSQWIFMPTGSALSVAGALAKNYWGPGDILNGSSAVPGTQGGAKGGFTVIQTSGAGTGQNFAGVFKAFTGTRTDTGSVLGANDMVGLYGEAQRGAGSSDGIWALNTVTEAYNLNGPTIGYEIDVNNFSGSDPGLTPAQNFLGLSVVSGASGRGGTAIEVNRNGAYTSNQWNRGISIREIWQRGVEFINCGNATGFWADTTMNFVATATTNPVAQFQPFGSSNVLLRGINAAANLILFDVDQNSTASETNAKLSVAGAAAQRVSVGIADSGGTGFRLLRVAN